MHRVKDALLAIGLGVVITILVASCSSPSSSPAVAALPGAVYASQLPLYPSATLESAMGGTTYAGRVGGRVINESLSWFFAVSDPPEKVLAFYEARLSGARRGVDDADDPTLTIVPSGADDGEYLRVTVRPGKLQITEVVRPGKRKDS
jgi:hypothetical protein